jgi:acyl dehydratase
MDEHREMKVTPDRYVTYRYAGASGDFNPIHLDDEFARSVGLPGKILHGLWTMAQVARAQGDGTRLRSLSVQFRGVGVPEAEMTVTSRPGEDGVVDCDVEQNGRKIVKAGRAVVARAGVGPAP